MNLKKILLSLSLLGSLFAWTSCSLDDQSAVSFSMESDEDLYEKIEQVNIDYPVKTQLAIQTSKPVIIGEVNENNEIVIPKIDLPFYVDEDNVVYSVKFDSFSKDLKQGSKHYVVYRFNAVEHFSKHFVLAHEIACIAPDIEVESALEKDSENITLSATKGNPSKFLEYHLMNLKPTI